MHWRRKWQPTPVLLPGESQGRGSLVGCRLWGRTESDTTEATYSSSSSLVSLSHQSIPWSTHSVLCSAAAKSYHSLQCFLFSPFLFSFHYIHGCCLVPKSDSLQPHGLLPHQALLSMEFPRQEYWSELPFLSPGDPPPDPGIKSASPSLAGRFFTALPPWKTTSMVAQYRISHSVKNYNILFKSSVYLLHKGPFLKTKYQRNYQLAVRIMFLLFLDPTP